MAKFAVCLSILAMASWAVAEVDIDDIDTHVEVSGTLGSDTHGEVEDNDGLTAIAPGSVDAQLEGDSELNVLQVNETLDFPAFVQSFVGCQCEQDEGSKPKWKCSGTIAYPPEVSGNECCCCGISCHPRNRCTNKQCLVIGVDQGPEVAAEQAAWDKLMQGADMLIGEDLPGFIVELEGTGQCTRTRIMEACKKKSLTPLCDHNSYSTTKECYTPAKSGNVFFNRHFSHWAGHRQYFGIEDDYLFYGMCFYARNGNWALAPCNGDSHCWTNGNSRLSPNARVLATGQVNNVYFNDMNNAKSKEDGGNGNWRTMCVKEQPNVVR